MAPARNASASVAGGNGKWAGGGMVYAVVSKTTGRKAVWVRLPPRPLLKNKSSYDTLNI